MTTTTRTSAAGLLVVGALALTACSPASDTPGTAAPQEASGDCVSKAEPVVQEAMKPLEVIFPDEPVDMSQLAGRELWIMQIVMNQWAGDVGKHIREAADAAGMEAVEWDGKGSVSTLNEGMSQAINANAAGIVLIGLDPTLIHNAVKEAEDAGIPVLDLLSDDLATPPVEGTSGKLTANFVQDGYDMAAWSALDSNCSANALFLQSTTIPLWVAQGGGAERAYSEICPADCDITIQNVDLAKVATNLTPEVQNALMRDPDINYVMPAWDSAVTFVTPAVEQVRPEAKILSKDGIPTGLDSVRNGGPQVVDVINPPIPWISWTIVDQLGRMATGGEMTDDLYIPTRLIDATNIGDSDEDIYGPEYVTQHDRYLELWGKK